ncbi:uncharacterized protein METZ01_LOCUS131402, partial [marine metagenome]
VNNLGRILVNKTFFLVVALLLVGLGSGAVLAQDSQMTFFITSAGSGNGADLGGLEGADRHCQALAASVGAGDK